MNRSDLLYLALRNVHCNLVSYCSKVSVTIVRGADYAMEYGLYARLAGLIQETVGIVFK